MKNLLIILIIALAISSCTKRIDIDLDETYTRLVVEGQITADTMQHSITLTTTTSYYYSEEAPRVSGAMVSLSDGDTTIQLDEAEDGVYVTSSDYYGIIGKTYTLDITLSEEINKHTDYTATSKMKAVAPIDSITLEFNESWGFEYWEIRLWAWEPPTVDFYMFNIARNGILVTDTIDEVVVSDDILFSGSFTNGIGVGWLFQEREDQKLVVGDTVTLIMSGITEEYCKYLWAVQDESGYNDPLFSGPPANVVGNISNGALGFFTAYANSTSSTIVKQGVPASF